MALERVIVTFPTDRFAYINGRKAGHTNEVLRVATGTHVFDLGPYANYEPESQEVEVEGTSVLRPKIVAFTRKDQ